MRKALVVTACFMLMAATASAGVAVFNGVRAEFAEDNSTAVMHPAMDVTAATYQTNNTLTDEQLAAIYGISSPGDGSGYTIRNGIARHSWYLSTTGAATNAALLWIPDTDDYEVTMSFVLPDAAWNGVNFHLNPSLTFNDIPGVSNIDLAATQHEGDKTAPEVKLDSGGIQLRAWDDVFVTFAVYNVNPALTVEGNPHDLSAANANRIALANFENRKVTFRTVKNNTTSVASFYMTVAGSPDFGTETKLFDTGLGIPLYKNDAGGPDTLNFRYRGEILNTIITVVGDSVPNVNAGALGINLPSMDVPFFVEK